MEKFTNLNNKIVIFGMSCAGKTTFANRLKEHTYYCFDALFQWHTIETLGLPISENLKYIQNYCCKDKFVLDGWHLSDSDGLYLPPESVVYVVWASYQKIINQYRVPVIDFNEHWHMYEKWYLKINYQNLPCVRFFENYDNFKEISQNEFNDNLKKDYIIFSKHNQQNLSSFETLGNFQNRFAK